MRKIVASDFDGTLTTCDTLVEFIRYACGNVRCFMGFLLFSPLIVLMKMRLYPNYKAKQKLFSFFFKGMTQEEFDALGKSFASCNGRIIRPGGRAMIEQCRRDNMEVVIVSASIDNWVQPFFPDVKVLGTKVEVQDGRLTGRFLTPNCYGQEKVNRLSALIPDRSQCYLIAYGDSRGDSQLLAYADESHYKPFR